MAPYNVVLGDPRTREGEVTNGGASALRALRANSCTLVSEWGGGTASLRSHRYWSANGPPQACREYLVDGSGARDKERG